MNKKQGFTLAEVLITLGVIGVVAAVTLPVLITNIQERIQKEQVRSAKYKLTLATDKMKSLGLLGEQYPTTQAFVTELSKHLKLAKICDNNHLRECWTSDEITLSDGTTKNVNTIKTGTDLVALAPGTKETTTMGIVTADGVPMILVYSPKCTPLETERTYSWSTVDNKPETNATTNCISALIDVNGNKKPNKIGKDVRTWNSLYAYRYFSETSYPPLARNGSDHYECKQLKDKLGIQNCREDDADDYWGGAVKKCHELGLHLPSTQTLALAAGARYGRSDITPYTVMSSVQYAKTNWASKPWFSADMTCEQIWRRAGIWSNSDQIICIDNGDSTNTNTSMGQDDDAGTSIKLSSNYWSASEYSATKSLTRTFSYFNSNWYNNDRSLQSRVLCSGD